MCNSLPVTYKKVKRKVKGTKLLRLGYKNAADGKPLKGDLTYEFQEQKKVDHFATVRKIFTENGIEAVVSYCNSLLRPKSQELLADKIAKMQAEQKNLSESLKNQNTEDGKQDFDLSIDTISRVDTAAPKPGNDTLQEIADPPGNEK